MCNPSGISFGIRNINNEEIRNKDVLEIGAYDVNGSLRPYLEFLHPKKYIGIDIQPGPRVDEICDVMDIINKFGKESFDTVISTELLEHVEEWQTAISNIKNVCRPGGTIILTTRSFGFPEHDYPSDYWRFELEDFSNIFNDCHIEQLSIDSIAPGVFIKIKKPIDFVEKKLDDYELYSIKENKRILNNSSNKILDTQSIILQPSSTSTEESPPWQSIRTPIRNDYNLDYLVFSSPKTASSTVYKTLSQNDFKTAQVHRLDNIGFEDGELMQYIKDYNRINKKKLEIITIFRDPIDRLVSVFFERYGTGTGKLYEKNIELSIFSRYTIKELIIDFTKNYILNNNRIEHKESINILSQELDFNVAELQYNPELVINKFIKDEFILYIFEFDTFIANMDKSISSLTNKEIKLSSVNQSKDKWYHSKYQEFKQTLKLPISNINYLYRSRQDLMDLFYGNEAEKVIQSKIKQYGK